MKGINESSQEIEFKVEDVKYFGVDVIENFTKKNNFSSFKKHNWIKTKEKLYVEYKISDMRTWFDKVILTNKKEKLKRKKDKIVRAVAKTYEVIKEGIIYLPSPVFKTLIECNSRRCLFSYKKVVYYFIMDHIYRNTETNDYLYIDQENETLQKTGFNMYLNKPTKYGILDWIKAKKGV